MCDTCQKCKVENVAYLCYYKTLPILERALEYAVMNFIMGRPSKRISVIVDCYSIYVNIFSLTYSSPLSKWLEYSQIINSMDYLQADSLPTRSSKTFFQMELFSGIQVRLQLSLVNPPQIDGKPKQLNGFLKTY